VIKVKLGLMLDYLNGQQDLFEYVVVDDGKAPEWVSVPVGGSWFPEAFIRSRASLMSYLDGSPTTLPASVEDAYRTMAVVEAAYQSNECGGAKVSYA
jgi:hypothetical protein